jgi:hypothetical protein
MNLESPSQTGLNRSQKRAPDVLFVKAVRMISTALRRRFRRSPQSRRYNGNRQKPPSTTVLTSIHFNELLTFLPPP